MLAAQGVGFHCAIMETLRRAMLPGQPEVLAIKLRASASQMSRSYSTVLHDLERRQSKPLPQRPDQTPPSGSGGPPDEPSPDAPVSGISVPAGSSTTPNPRPRRVAAKATSAEAAGSDVIAPMSVRDGPPPPETADLDDEAGLPEDIETRADGTPGSLSGYVPKPPVVEYVPREPAIMFALATRPKPWRMVNTPADTAAVAPPVPDDAPPAEQNPPEARGLLDLREKIFTGDALARFASARFDADAPIEKLVFEDEDSVVELEMVSTGGDPEAEAERQAMMAAHPEGKPIITIRHGTRAPLTVPPDSEGDENPPDI